MAGPARLLSRGELARSKGRFGAVVAALSLIVFLVLVLGALADGLFYGATGAVRSSNATAYAFSDDAEGSLIRSRLDESDVSAFRSAPAERRQGGMHAEAQALLQEEIEHFRPARGGLGGEGANAAGLKTVLAGAPQPAPRAPEIARPALRVVERLWPIQARAQGGVELAKKLAKLVRQQPQVALDSKTRRQAIPQDGQSGAIKFKAGGERLPAVEGDLEAFGVPQLILPVHDGLHSFQRHDRALKMRPKAVRAVGRAG